MQHYYKRNLPHWQPDEAEFFVTFRLAGSLPKEAVAHLKNEKNRLLSAGRREICSSGSLPEQLGLVKGESAGSDRLSDLHAEIRQAIFKKYEQLLDLNEVGPTWLKKVPVADIIKEAIHHRDQKEYDLYAYCIMPNHVHMVFKLIKQKDSSGNDSQYLLTSILKSLKWYTALKSNQILKRTGSFWQPESYDHVIRGSNELGRIISYTINNPVNAGLVEKWEEWPYTYCRPDFCETYLNK